MRTSSRNWLALLSALIAVFIDMVDNQIVVIALPSMQHDLHLDPSAMQWTAAGYTLALALTLIVGARLGDKMGYRAVFMVGTLGFALASLASALAPHAGILIAARLAQGLCAGLMVPQVLAFIQLDFDAASRPKAMALYGATFPIGGLTGPLIGGALLQLNALDLGWRTLFLVNIPVAIIAALGAAILMPPGPRDPATSIDLGGVLLLGVGLLALLFPLVQGHELGWPAWIRLMLLAAVPAFASFVTHQRRREAAGREPLVRLSLFRQRSLSVGLAVMTMAIAGSAAFFVVSIGLQRGSGFSPLQTALTLLPAAVGIVIGNGIGMKQAPTPGQHAVRAGLLVLAAGAIATAAAFAWFGTLVSPWTLVAPVIVYGLGLGLSTSALLIVTLADVPPREAATASGILNTAMQIGVAIGLAAVGSIFFSRLAAGDAYPQATDVALSASAGIIGLALLTNAAFPQARPRHAAEDGQPEVALANQ